MSTISQTIKALAIEVGFDACGFCKAEYIGDEESRRLQQWLTDNHHGKMNYMEGYYDKRCDPSLLVEGAKSVVSLALNYYPHTMQDASAPQFAYYAYGKDYHDVMKEKLQLLFSKIKEYVPALEGRVFCDTAPVMERYWAAKAGLGFIGKNSLLIIPKKGSFFFLGELIVNIELDYDAPLNLSCGNCTRCLDACPTKAIIAPRVIDARRCISYQTIENREEIDDTIVPNLNNRLYGCDICQIVCPWNSYSRPHNTAQFNPSEAFMNLSDDKIGNLSIEEYQAIFKGSAVKRAKYSGLKRNWEALKRNRT